MFGIETVFNPELLIWRNLDGSHRRSESPMKVVAPLKRGRSQSSRPVYCVEEGADRWLLKVRYYGSLRKRLAVLGKENPMAHEIEMLGKASSLGLPVPLPVAICHPGLRSSACWAAMLQEWVPGHSKVRDWVVDAVSMKRESELRTVEQQIAKCFTEVRRAGFADNDFGPHNLMFASELDIPSNLLWIDLEFAIESAATDAAGTVSMMISLLKSWWVVSAQNQGRLQAMFSTLCTSCPEPDEGWGAIVSSVNDGLRSSLAGPMRTKRITRYPEILFL